MASASSIYDQVTQILNSQDANGNYIYGGDQNNTPPVKTSSLSDLASLSSVSQAFTSGTVKGSVQVGDGQTVQVGLLASNIGSGILQTLSDIANFNSGSNGNFGTTLTGCAIDIPVERDSRRGNPPARPSTMSRPRTASPISSCRAHCPSSRP